MAMNTISRGGLQAAINMTPMIDVLLVLLIIFMAIAPGRSAGLNALVPSPPSTLEQRPPEEPVVLEIGADGSYRINTQPLNPALLRERLNTIFARRGDRLLFVQGAPALEFGVVARAIDAARSANVERIALMPR
jgi:biopolymer transport protein ExbD